MKNCKIFCKAERATLNSAAPPPHSPHHTPYQVKPCCVSGTKDFLRRYIEIYKHLHSKCFKNVVLGRQERVQYNYFF